MKQDETSKKLNYTVDLTHVHMSRISALGILGAFFIFMAGYYWGKKGAAEDLTHMVAHESLADKVYSSVCSRYKPQAEQSGDAEGAHEVREAQEAALSESASNQLPFKRFSAELIGFGSRKAAGDYVKRLAARGIAAESVERVSRTAQGKRRIWYQVVTPPMGYEELCSLVAMLKTVDHLTGEKIIELASETS